VKQAKQGNTDMATDKKPVPTDNAMTVADTGSKPSYLIALEQANKGTQKIEDNFDSSDIVIPRVKLLQTQSKELENFEEARAGNFWHTGFDISLGEALNFIVCARRKRYILTAPLEDGQGVLARADDFLNWDRTGSWNVKIKGVKNPVKWEITSLNVEESGLAKWGSFNPDDEDSPPAATMFYDYLIILPDFREYGPCVLSLARTQIRKARKGLNDKIALHGSAGRPLQAIKFNVKPVKEEGPSGSYLNVQFSGNGFSTEDEFMTALSFKGMLETHGIADEVGAAEEARSGESNAIDKDMANKF